MKPELIIFDLDGVVADSERLASQVLADYVTELGFPMSEGYSLDHFTGRRIGDVRSAIERLIGRPVDDFAATLVSRTLKAFDKGLKEVDGLSAFLAATEKIRRCIASSSTHERIRFCLDTLGLNDRFNPVVSADDVEHGKPAPDIFLYASRLVGVSPASSVVIEDSPGGVQAGVAAGMPVIGLLAASHLRVGHEGKLRDAGASFIARTYREVADIVDWM